MLVLSRRKEESILIPSHNIVIKVVEVTGGKVRIGIDAPPDVAIYRHEVWENIQRNNNEQAE